MEDSENIIQDGRKFVVLLSDLKCTETSEKMKYSTGFTSIGCWNDCLLRGFSAVATRKATVELKHRCWRGCEVLDLFKPRRTRELASVHWRENVAKFAINVSVGVKLLTSGRNFDAFSDIVWWEFLVGRPGYNQQFSWRTLYINPCYTIVPFNEVVWRTILFISVTLFRILLTSSRWGQFERVNKQGGWSGKYLHFVDNFLYICLVPLNTCCMFNIVRLRPGI